MDEGPYLDRIDDAIVADHFEQLELELTGREALVVLARLGAAAGRQGRLDVVIGAVKVVGHCERGLDNRVGGKDRILQQLLRDQESEYV